MKTVACIIARTNSTRLPQKALKKINDRMLIEHIIDRIKLCNNVDEIYICTSTNKCNDVLKDVAEKNKIKFYAGSEEAVIDRMLDVAKLENADNVIRITGDNIFTDNVYLDIMIDRHNNDSYDYTRTEYLPLGVTAEVISVRSLIKCRTMMDPNENHLILYLFNPEVFKCLVLTPYKKHQHPKWSFTIDTPEDWERTEYIFSKSNDFITLDMVVNIVENYSVPHLEYGATGIIQCPANLTMYFETFKRELELRVLNSDTEDITHDEYLKVLKNQSR